MKRHLFWALGMALWSAASAFPLWAASASENPYVFLAEAESLFGYSKIAGDEEGDFSTTNKWLASLGYRTDPETLLVGAYNGSYDRTNVFIAQEEGARQSNKLMTNNFSLALKKNVTESFAFRPSLFYNIVWIEETADEELGDGLYDYEDLGGGFENTHRWGEGDDERALKYGFDFFSREYPNYTSLLSTFDPNGSLEENEKDFLGYKATAGWEAPVWGAMRGAIGYTFLFKDYTDKLTINSNGIRQGDKREDVYQEVTASLFHRIAECFAIGVTSSFDWNLSNLDLYDTRNTASLADDRFFEDYYDYWSVDVTPSVHFYHRMDEEGKRVARLTFAYTFEGLFYPDRTALDPAGNLTSEDQRDYGHVATARLAVPLTKQVSWITAAHYKSQDSNQKFENVYRYNYELWSARTGIAFEY